MGMSFLVVLVVALPIMFPVTIQPFVEYFLYRRWQPQLASDSGLSSRDCSAVVAAYYPTEASQFRALVDHWVDLLQQKAVAEVFIVVNGDGCEQAIDFLNEEINVSQQLHIVVNHDGRTKAANLNRGLSSVRTEAVVLFDADARPTKECIGVGLRSMTCDVVAVQGANLPTRGSETDLLGRLVVLDYALKYGATYPMRWSLYRSAYFAGSNGYWRTSVLRDFEFDEEMFVEDIDLSARVLKMGHLIASCPEALCVEEAPPNWRGWALQRYRWAFGWRQVALRYLPSLMNWNAPIAVRMNWVLALGLALMRPVSWVILLSLAVVWPSAWRGVALMLALWTVSILATSRVKLAAARDGTHWAGRIPVVSLWPVMVLLPLYELALAGVGVVGLMRRPSRWHATGRRG